MSDHAMIEGPGNPVTVPDESNVVRDGNASVIVGYSEGQVKDLARQKASSALNINQIGKGLPGFLADTVGNIGKAFLNGLAGLANGLGSAFDGIFSSTSKINDDFTDMQNLIEGNYKLLDGVRGYCQSYQSLNINIAWNASGNRRVLPYNGKFGPTKGAHIAGNGITFDEAGLWLVFVSARAKETSYGGSDVVGIFVDVFNPDGSLYSPIIFDGRPGGDYSSITGAFPVLIEKPGQYIVVSSWSGKWRWWSGGSRYARLAVVKQDNRVVDKPVDLVPDESQ